MVSVPELNVRKEKEPVLSMSDKEIIITSLRRIERRIRANRLLSELNLGAALLLVIPVLLKLWDLVVPMRGVTVSILVGTWILLFAGFVTWRLSKKGTLEHAAGSADKEAGLHDGLKSAFWFINNPRQSEWVDAHIRRAARDVQRLRRDVLYPRQIPKTSYIA